MADDTLVDLLPSQFTAEEREAAAVKAQADADRAAAVESETDAQKRAASEFAYYKQQAERLGPLSSIADILESDPSKIFDVKAVLEGRLPSGAQAPAAQSLSPEQIEALDEQFRQRPSQFASAAAQLAARQEVENIYKSTLAPAIDAAGEGLVASYKTQRNDDPLYKQIANQFDKEMGDVDRSALLRASTKDRARALDLRWQAAKAAVLQKAMDEDAVSSKSRPPTLSGGGGGGGNTPRNKIERDPDLIRLALATGGITREELEQIVGVAQDYQE